MFSIKDLKKIKKHSNNTSSVSTFAIFVNAQLLNSNYLKVLSKTSFLSLVYYVKNKLSNLESIIDLKTKAEYNLNKKTNLLS